MMLSLAVARAPPCATSPAGSASSSVTDACADSAAGNKGALPVRLRCCCLDEDEIARIARRAAELRSGEAGGRA